MDKMGRRLVRSAIAVIMVAGCAVNRTPETVITEPAGSFVRLDPDPAVATGRGNAHPASVSPDRLGALLATIQVESPGGAFLGQSVKLSLVDPDDLAFLAPAVSKALARAGPYERVVFYLRQRGRLLRPEVTTGAVAVRGASLSVTLGHYRRTDAGGLEEDNRGMQIEDELKAHPMYGVHDVGVRLSVRPDQRWRPGDGPRTIVLPL